MNRGSKFRTRLLPEINASFLAHVEGIVGSPRTREASKDYTSAKIAMRLRDLVERLERACKVLEPLTRSDGNLPRAVIDLLYFERFGSFRNGPGSGVQVALDAMEVAEPACRLGALLERARDALQTAKPGRGNSTDRKPDTGWKRVLPELFAWECYQFLGGFPPATRGGWAHEAIAETFDRVRLDHANIDGHLRNACKRLRAAHPDIPMLDARGKPRIKSPK